MADFLQNGVITTLHDLGNIDQEELERMLEHATMDRKIGLVLPVTASDMRAEPFSRIVEQLTGANYIEQIAVVLGAAPEVDDYREAVRKTEPLGQRARVLWSDGPRIGKLYDTLTENGLNLSAAGKGRSVWTAFGYLLASPQLSAFVLHDCDIVTYSPEMPARLSLPLVHTALDFEFCKAYYARYTDRLHGRAVRLLVTPLLRALISVIGYSPLLAYLSSFRYPLSGEFAVTANLARSNRIPSDWGLEIGTLAEVFRNTSTKRVCQVDLCAQYEHKHQELSKGDPSKGLMKMARDVLTTLFRTLASMGVVWQSGHFETLRSAYLRAGQDTIRQYHADALINGLQLDRHAEEEAVEAFAGQITTAGEIYRSDPLGGEAIPNWNRVLGAMPEFPRRLEEAVQGDAEEFAEA